MSMALERFCLKLPLMMPFAVLLSVVIGVGGWGCLDFMLGWMNSDRKKIVEAKGFV